MKTMKYVWCVHCKAAQSFTVEIQRTAEFHFKNIQYLICDVCGRPCARFHEEKVGNPKPKAQERTG